MAFDFVFFGMDNFKKIIINLQIGTMFNMKWVENEKM